MFHVPEANRILVGIMGTSAREDGANGAFVLPSPDPGWVLVAMASDGTALPEDDVVEAKRVEDWEHVSVHAATEDGQTRVPTWPEMAHVKGLFWDPEDLVLQQHPREVLTHEHVLHLWRRRPVPRLEFV